jgi:hypothetical protein
MEVDVSDPLERVHTI